MPERFVCAPQAQHVHDGLVAVNRFIHAQPSLGGWMQTYVTSGNIHQANYRDKVIVATLIERLRRFGVVDKGAMAVLPFDMLLIVQPAAVGGCEPAAHLG